MTGRTVPEWIGKTPDTAIPARVRARVFDRAGGVCHISGRKIQAGEEWHCDHIKPLADGGEHREGNLAPALGSEHRRKTSAENAQRAVERRKREKHLGIKRPVRNPLPGSKASGWRKKINGEVVPR